MLPPLRNGETARLHDPKIEDKETRPPPSYNEGTLIEAMQNAWRFVDDEALRERLKEAKGIGTPATRAEIIGGLRKQGFLIADGKNIVPTETGLALFGVLKQADPALVDPGATAQLECLLDDIMVGKQEMVGAIDAVCDVAERIIGKLKEGAAAGGTPLLGAAVSNSAGGRPPTPAMKRYADSLARQRKIKPPPGYKSSMSICRSFLNQHAPKKSDGEVGDRGIWAGDPAHIVAKETAPDGNVGISTQAAVSLAAIPEPIDGNLKAKRRKRARKTASKPNLSAAPKSTVSNTRAARRKAVGSAPSSASTSARQNSEVVTPLRIPYGNKEVALRLGARYGARGWYAPPGIDLSAFAERGWL